MIFSLLAAGSLAAMAAFDTRQYEAIHLYCAIGFFVFDALFITLNTIGFELHRRSEPTEKAWRRSTLAKCVLAALFWAAVIVYLPVGLAVVCAFEKNEVTREYDYSNCSTENVMRIVAQYASVLFTMCYFASFYFDLFRASDVSRM